jgi:hypothetical protein
MNTVLTEIIMLYSLIQFSQHETCTLWNLIYLGVLSHVLRVEKMHKAVHIRTPRTPLHVL